MRLDKFLKVSRLIKRRTSAAKASEAGRVLVNGIQAKPAKQIKQGDTITVEYASGALSVKILSVPDKNISAQEADSLYEIIEN